MRADKMSEHGTLHYTHFEIEPDTFFAGRVHKEIYVNLFEKNESLHGSLRIDAVELAELSKHPMFGNIAIYRRLLTGIGKFYAQSLRDDNDVRMIVIRIGLYLDPVVVTATELELWEMPKESRAAVIREAGILTGDALVAKQKALNRLTPITRADFIKALLTIGNVANSLPHTPEVQFLLDNRA